MKVLFLSSWFPYPPDNGSRIRIYNLMKGLAARHQVHLIALMQDDSKREDAERLRDICEVWSLHESRWFRPGTLKSFVGYLSSRPRSVVDTFDPAVARSVKEAIRSISPDVVIASTLGVVEYVPSDLRIPSLLEQHNCEYAVLRRASGLRSGLSKLRYDLGWRKFARWEARMCRKFDAVAMVSEGDVESLLEVAPDLRNVCIVPNGVDAEHYRCGDREPEPGTLIYNGALTYGANLDAVRYFASEVYPILRAKRPDAKLRVTGRTDGVDLRGIEDCPGIELTGYVSDIRDVLRTSAACIVPLRHGGGSRLKILEAMASGVPVISTSMGAEGIDCRAGEHLLVADEPEEFAEAIARVLADSDLAERLAADARKLIEERYTWKAIGAAFSDIVEQTVANRRSL